MFYNMEMFLVVFMALSGLYVFTSMRSHLLVSLLSLEYLVLCIFICFVCFLMGFFGDYYLLMMFLVFSVCEGVLGLSILVNLIRTHGNDYVMSLSMLGW